MTTPITNTYVTDAAVGLREDLADIIALVDPLDTPLYSNLPKVEARAKVHDWQEWAIPATATPDYKSEGEEPDRSAATPTTRYTNACSIFWRDFTVSGTLDAVSKAGRRREMALQQTQFAMIVKREVETALLANTARDTSEPRKIAGLPTWAGGADGSTVSSAVAAHTPAALETAQGVLAGRGRFGDTVLMLPANKATFSGTSKTASAKDIESATTERAMGQWAGAVSIYLTDYGLSQMVVDRFLETYSLVLDKSQFRIAEMNGGRFTPSDLGKTGDAFQRMIKWEGTLEATSPNAVEILV